MNPNIQINLFHFELVYPETTPCATHFLFPQKRTPLPGGFFVLQAMLVGHGISHVDVPRKLLLRQDVLGEVEGVPQTHLQGPVAI